MTTVFLVYRRHCTGIKTGFHAYNEYTWQRRLQKEADARSNLLATIIDATYCYYYYHHYHYITITEALPYVGKIGSNGKEGALWPSNQRPIRPFDPN